MALFIGKAFMVVGGILLLTIVLGGIGWLSCQVWASFSNRFRYICKVESMIFEYRKYREQFLAWLEIK